MPTPYATIPPPANKELELGGSHPDPARSGEHARRDLQAGECRPDIVRAETTLLVARETSCNPIPDNWN